MAKTSEKPLQPNPFITYRDPQTGTWITIQAPDLLSNQMAKETDDLVDSAQEVSSSKNPFS